MLAVNLEFDCINRDEPFENIHLNEMLQIPAYQWTYFDSSK